MLRDFAAAVRARAPGIAVALVVAGIVAAAAGCGIKGPLRLPAPAAPVATDVGPPAPTPDANPDAAKKP
jgi:predicted small lipoprotein YifL